jgi:predicted short-subunit dehydrogenase-like oxidoreductase (DUF2520 family)
MKVVVLGSGNLATQLSLSLHAKGVNIIQIYSHTKENAFILANKINTSFTDKLEQINLDADLYIYALSDRILDSTLLKFPLPANAIHIHTAGSIPITVFEGLALKYGIFYPLQTFSKQRDIDFSQIPICIEANSKVTENELINLACLLNSKTYLINSEQRKKLHLAAVFACNFSNYMYDLASTILNESGISFEIIEPLIAETASKIKSLSPYNAQTGPALRNDEITMEKHLDLLKNDAELSEIYKLLSKNIHKRH